MTQTHLATSADYADALLTARKAKTVITLLLLFVLVAELALFFCLRYYKPLSTSTDQHVRDVLQYGVGLLDIGALILPLLLAVVIFLILQVQLVGRLLGTDTMTAAFLYSVLLALLLFPWQAVLNNPAILHDPVANSLGMKIPGVVYTWAEVSNPTVGALFGLGDVKQDLFAIGLHWARYVGFPVLSVLILLIIHSKTRRGLRQSLRDDSIVVATTPLP